MAKHRLEDVIPRGLPVAAPAPALRAEDTVSFSVTEVPGLQGPTILGKIRTGLQKLAPVGHALAETGRWFNRHKIGVARAIGTVTACAAVVSTARTTGDLGLYATIHEAGKTFIDLDTPAEGLLAGGAAGALSVMSALAAITMNNFRREDAEALAYQASKTPEKPEQPVIDVEKLGYPRPGQRLTWMDEDDIFVSEPLLSQKKVAPAGVLSLSEVDTLFSEIEQVLREDSGQYQLVSAAH